MVFGEPEQWLALLIESLLVAGRGEHERVAAAAGAGLRRRRRRRPGDIDGRPFEWIADADTRLGPVLEAVINGRYYWVPFSASDQDRASRRRRPARPGLDAGAPRSSRTAASRWR